MLYTPLSEADIFPPDEKAMNNRHLVSHQGKQLFVEDKGNGSYELLQLLSTDPQDFMDTQYSPGTIIS